MARTSLPTCWDVTSGPLRRTRVSIRPTICSICKGEVGLPAKALRIPAASFSRSKGSELPSRFATTNPTSSIRSKVVNRRPQVAHSRRRRIEPPPSAGRESTTRSSSAWHQGQRMRTGHKM